MTKYSISNGSILQFDYVNWKGEASYRTIAPMTIFYGSTMYHQEDQWLMVAYDLDKTNLRIFAMDQMTNIIPKGDVNNA